ncbi:PAS domain S-box protein [Salinimicrobium xinjiangense]|uniref:PAS domain S-box protein n=1 Tax=Salinimicrobium xinjiangense TaxID=438596 RepID=UPI00048AFE7E|nr:PAS domain S-box protein [Salinimicrobium xinjiangense]
MELVNKNIENPVHLRKIMKDKCKILFKNLPLACLLLKPDGEEFIVSDVNDEFCRILGKKRKNILNLSIREIFQYKTVQFETVTASLRQTLLDKKPVIFDYLGYDNTKTSQESFWQVTNIPIKENDQENITYILHLPWDKTAEVIEERKRLDTERELEEKKSENDCFIQKSQDGLFSLDPKGNFLSVNAGIVNLAEVPAEQLLKMNFLPFCSAQYRDQIFGSFLKALGGEDQNFEADFISSKGRKVILDVSLVPMKIHGEIMGVYGIARDITNKKLSEKIIKEQQDQLIGSKNKFRALVQESSDLTGILDLEGNYKFVSESSISILGISPQEFTGKNAFDFIHPDDKETVMSYFIQAQNKKQVNIPSLRFIDREGNYRWLQTTVTNLTNDPFVMGFVTNSRDITESKLLWEETLRQNKILNTIAWEHAHIVRAPVVRLKSLLDLMQRENYKIWDKKELVRLMNVSLEELDNIILETVRKTEDVENRQPN